jgi:hypothetical protein
VNEEVLPQGLGEILRLADENLLPLDTLHALPHLCASGARARADGHWLRQLFVNPEPTDGLAEADRPRRETARLPRSSTSSRVTTNAPSRSSEQDH